MTATIAFDNLTLGYDRHPAVHHLSGTIKSGALLAVVGPNGAGKSTLLKGIAGLLKPLGGTIRLADTGRRRLAYLPQAVEIDHTFPVSVHEFVTMGAWQEIGMFAGLTGAAQRRVAEALVAVGLSGFEQRPIGTLSGGQFQRALFARLLLQDSPIILLDEPFTSIDQRTTADLVEIIRRWHREKRTVIAVLHDLSTVRDCFPQALLLAREPVGWGPTETTLTDSNLAAARHMVEAVDSQAHACERAA